MSYQFEFQLREDYKRYVTRNEGVVDYFYLDSTGHVTIGIGHCVRGESEAMGLHMIDKNTGMKATSKQLKEEYELIKSKSVGYSVHYYGQFTSLYMEYSDINQLFQVDFTNTLLGLKRVFLDFDTYPETVQLALIDMAFNLGSFGITHKYKFFTKAVLQKNWKMAADQSYRSGLSNERNMLVKNWLLQKTAVE